MNKQQPEKELIYYWGRNFLIDLRNYILKNDEMIQGFHLDNLKLERYEGSDKATPINCLMQSIKEVQYQAHKDNPALQYLFTYTGEEISKYKEDDILLLINYVLGVMGDFTVYDKTLGKMVYSPSNDVKDLKEDEFYIPKSFKGLDHQGMFIGQISLCDPSVEDIYFKETEVETFRSLPLQ